ncbi:transcriptional regulator [Catenulispora subtropica]|uniref:ParB N-terminal domain-containing protein n=1 Tax=Catenulispora subtropica TaxID=450798 RepID=A0ABN2THT1_9ACTN
MADSDGSTEVNQLLIDDVSVLPRPAGTAGPATLLGPVPPRRPRPDSEPRTVAVPLSLLLPGESPRLEGQDAAHVARLAEVEAPLPPILVDRRTMRVIDGTHRLMAAAVNHRPTIDVVFFEGDPADVFLRAVEANVAHGFPLSLNDRRAAARRIIASHRHLSDRAIAQVTGLSAKTIAMLRHQSEDDATRPTSRIGRDGRARPLNGGERRARVAELMTERPHASLRELARIAGVSPATASDVRKRLLRGEAPSRTAAASAAHGGAHGAAGRDRAGASSPEPPNPAPVLEKLVRDPSLRHTENGRQLLRLMQTIAIGVKELPALAVALPPHSKGLVRQLAEIYARMWQEFARDLEDEQ